MVYVLINLKTWNGVTVGYLVLWVSMALSHSRIKLCTSILLVPVVDMWLNVTNGVAVLTGLLFIYCLFFQSHFVALVRLKFDIYTSWV